MGDHATSMDKHAIARSIALERQRTLDLLRPLEPSRLDASTALPGWRIREVVAHLITTDAASVTGRILPVVLRGSTEVIERWNERQVAKWADRPVPELLAGLERWGRRFATFARAFPASMYRLSFPTLWGRGPAGLLLWSRVYDEWIHRQDMRRALGLKDDALDMASVAEFMLEALSHDLRRWPAGPAGIVAVSLSGVPLTECRYDVGVRRGVPDPAEGTDARLTAPGRRSS
jgi:uncharacterized protein (TIGR03083 family)